MRFLVFATLLFALPARADSSLPGPAPKAKATKAKEVKVSDGDEDNEAAPEDFVCGMRRNRCVGPCPRYAIWVFKDGRVQYYGYDNVKVLGDGEWRITKRQVAQLRAAFAAANYTQLVEDYLPRDGLMWVPHLTPHGMVELRLGNLGGHHFPDDDGDRSRRLTQLEDEIDRIAGTARFIGITPQRKHATEDRGDD